MLLLLLLVRMRHVVFLLPLHSPVLEPDFDLSLAKVQHVGDLDASTSRQVAVEMELLLELEGLVAGVRRSGSLRVDTVAVVS